MPKHGKKGGNHDGHDLIAKRLKKLPNAGRPHHTSQGGTDGDTAGKTSWENRLRSASNRR